MCHYSTFGGFVSVFAIVQVKYECGRSEVWCETKLVGYRVRNSREYVLTKYGMSLRGSNCDGSGFIIRGIKKENAVCGGSGGFYHHYFVLS